MKKITLEKVLTSLEQDIYEVKVPPEVAARARGAIQRMLELA
jgi:quinolinate synthase